MIVSLRFLISTANSTEPNTEKIQKNKDFKNGGKIILPLLKVLKIDRLLQSHAER